MTVCSVWLCTTSADVVDTSSVVSVSVILVLSETSSLVIFNDPSHSDNTSMSVPQHYQSVLFIHGFYYNIVVSILVHSLYYSIIHIFLTV